MDEAAARRIFDKLDELHTIAVQTKSDASHTATIIAKLDYTVHGNGVPGLDERVRNLERTAQGAKSLAAHVAQWLAPILVSLMASGAVLWVTGTVSAKDTRPRTEQEP